MVMVMVMVMVMLISWRQKLEGHLALGGIKDSDEKLSLSKTLFKTAVVSNLFLSINFDSILSPVIVSFCDGKSSLAVVMADRSNRTTLLTCSLRLDCNSSVVSTFVSFIVGLGEA